MWTRRNKINKYKKKIQIILVLPLGGETTQSLKWKVFFYFYYHIFNDILCLHASFELKRGFTIILNLKFHQYCIYHHFVGIQIEFFFIFLFLFSAFFHIGNYVQHKMYLYIYIHQDFFSYSWKRKPVLDCKIKLKVLCVYV